MLAKHGYSQSQKINSSIYQILTFLGVILTNREKALNQLFKSCDAKNLHNNSYIKFSIIKIILKRNKKANFFN